MPNLNDSDFEAEFLRQFPEWVAEFETHFGDYAADEDIGNYIIVGDFIIPKLRELAAHNNIAGIKKTFAFFEQVASWEPICGTLIHIEIGEWLELNPSAETEYMKKFAGPFVLNAMKEIADWHASNQRPEKC